MYYCSTTKYFTLHISAFLHSCSCVYPITSNHDIGTLLCGTFVRRYCPPLKGYFCISAKLFLSLYMYLYFAYSYVHVLIQVCTV